MPQFSALAVAVHAARSPTGCVVRLFAIAGVVQDAYPPTNVELVPVFQKFLDVGLSMSLLVLQTGIKYNDLTPAASSQIFCKYSWSQPAVLAGDPGVFFIIPGIPPFRTFLNCYRFLCSLFLSRPYFTNC